MNKIVIDANIVFFAVLSQSSYTREVFQGLLDEDVDILAPYFIYGEVLNVFLRLTEQRWLTYDFHKAKIQRILELIDVVDYDFYADVIEKVKAEVDKIDPKDMDYVALAYKLWAPLWSNDKRLKKLKSIKVLTTQDLLEAKA